jgi:hypothetical protein
MPLSLTRPALAGSVAAIGASGDLPLRVTILAGAAGATAGSNSGPTRASYSSNVSSLYSNTGATRASNSSPVSMGPTRSRRQSCQFRISSLHLFCGLYIEIILWAVKSESVCCLQHLSDVVRDFAAQLAVIDSVDSGNQRLKVPFKSSNPHIFAEAFLPAEAARTVRTATRLKSDSNFNWAPCGPSRKSNDDEVSE